MQFSSTFIFSLLVSTGLAAPTSPENEFVKSLEAREPGILSDIGNAIRGKGDSLTVGKCTIAKCAAALGPTAVGCGAAAAQAFVDPISDVACIAASINTIANKPSACDNCDPKSLEKAVKGK